MTMKKRIIVLFLLFQAAFAYCQIDLTVQLERIHSENSSSHIVDTLLVYKDHSLFKKIPYPGSYNYIKDIPFGKYKFCYKNLFNESIEKTITFDSSNREESQNVILYVDESQNLNSKKLFIDSLKKNETMMIQLSFSGCFTDGEETILVFKKGKKLYLNYHNKVKKLKKREIEAIKVYENELRNLPEACFMSTANSFHKVSLNSQEFTYSEPSSFWGGFEILKKRLRLDSVNQ